MKKIFILLLVFLLVLPIPTFASVDDEKRIDAIEFIVDEITENLPTDLSILQSYSDIGSIDEFAQKRLAYALEHGIIVGYEDHTLRLDDYVTRGEFATMLYRASNLLEKYPTLGECTVQFEDASDWNHDAITYCVEHGFLMGYGDNYFGSEDHITTTQVTIVTQRMKNGLTTLEKYQFLSYNGTSPIRMEPIIESGYSPEFKLDYSQFISPDPEIKPWDLNAQERLDLLKQFQDYTELAHGFDYRQYDTDEKIQERAEKLKWVLRDNISWDRYFKNLQENHIRAEAFFVASPDNCAKSYAPSLYAIEEANGYEYFIYYEADSGALPEGVELNKWYRRKADLRLWRWHSHDDSGNGAVYWYSVYSTPEPVPPELLNE